MKNKYLWFVLFVVGLTSCGKSNTSTNTNTPPTNLQIGFTISPDSSGNVSFVATANNAVSYLFDFGDGNIQTVTSGNVNYKYAVSGNYTVNVTAQSAGGQTITKSTQVLVGVKLTLVWSDEFSTPGAPDATKWAFDVGTGTGGWGNNELEYYTSRLSNASVANGYLTITANKESYNGSAYTSARMLTQGLYSFQYGRIDISAKLPASIGTWPAIWMLGNDISTVTWPACGEIDIMEQSGSNKNTIYGTLHYPTEVNPNGDGGTTPISTASSAFHKYSAIWSAASIQLLVDDVVYYTLPNSNSIPFNQNFFIILNVAMGGNFGGTVSPTFTSDSMVVDYVRVYQ